MFTLLSLADHRRPKEVINPNANIFVLQCERVSTIAACLFFKISHMQSVLISLNCLI